MAEGLAEVEKVPIVGLKGKFLKARYQVGCQDWAGWHYCYYLGLGERGFRKGKEYCCCWRKRGEQISQKRTKKGKKRLVLRKRRVYHLKD